ncbi:acyltransferase domain-containing protein [Streptomyces luomodiensis]|uniref:Acyltransferase domain-containing protein n=1 Tax=Streptomyces luomodiensis TaxID=3026192 RepID=A0ABY9UZX9_9ACTN|nr:acyltransferase domain-containing protein [Streptomyces sp. SCA4-21]WNE95409.1 acyltransferase domain-containing protein [Streptomyces sp. SCA4-21]
MLPTVVRAETAGLAPAAAPSPPWRAGLWEAGAFPCGFCLSGRLSALCDLPRVNPEPDAREVRDALVDSQRAADRVRGPLTVHRGRGRRHFCVHLYLLALPSALARQRRRGVPDGIAAATFAGVGAKMATYRLAHQHRRLSTGSGG